MPSFPFHKQKEEPKVKEDPKPVADPVKRIAELKELMTAIEAESGGFGHIPIKSDYWEYRKELVRLSDENS